ncbi:alpha/beta hydrolase [Solimonas sp. K1W22B-7]|uniref:alpha/beta hydrolase n=1 Tax=Solimonas sp. K1W22B-7 TaxID=2303331 RepID=UPI001F08ADDB|nr:alpha/beta fold hydrolase [Solimonas sp. K1W22B-7]
MELPQRGQSSEWLVEGPAGQIEALLSAPRGPEPPAGFAVICHPHPLFGGALSNKVVYTLSSVALQAGLYTLRFNFRGVGRSAGPHDEGRGETRDVLHLAGLMQEMLPGGRRVLAGFSFGAFVALKAAAELRPDALVGIAPPFGKYFGGEAPPPHPGCPWLVVHSRDDDTVDYEDTRQTLMTYTPPPQLVTVDGAGHFFHGKLGEISGALLPFLQSL